MKIGKNDSMGHLSKLNPLRLLNIATLCRSQLLLPVLFLFYRENGLSTGDFFLFKGIISIITHVAEVPCGYAGYIFPKKNILITSFLLLLFGTSLWIFFGGYWIILIGEISFCLSKAFFNGVSDSYIYEYLKLNDKSQKMLSKYGKLNFFLSLGSALTSVFGAVFYTNFGAKVLLFIDFALISFAIILLLLIPQLPVYHEKINGLKSKYIDIYRIIKKALKNTAINGYIWYSGILISITYIMVFCFQPIMKISNIPVKIFGVIYFINHFFRAISAMELSKILKKITLKKLGYISYFSFLASFILMSLSYCFKNSVFTIISLVLICIAIAIQLTFTLGTTSFIHTKVLKKSRSTVSSLNYMIAKGLSGLILISFKYFINFSNLNMPIIIYGILFMFSYIIIKNKL